MRAVAAVLFLLFLAGAAHSAIIFVPDHHPTIQAAIDAAAGGDLVVVRGGMWFENINFSGKAVEVRSFGGPRTTIINGSGAGSVVTFDSGEGPGSILRGFTVFNGRAAYGGGVYCGAGTSPVIEDNIIKLNEATSGGGGICCDNFSSPTITGNTVTENTASNGSGGGFVYRYKAAPIIDGNTISNNSARFYGGGIDSYYGDGATITGNAITGNQCGNGGGAIHLYRDRPTIIDNTMTGNSADDGGAIHDFSSEAFFQSNTMSQNTASNRGGGIYTDSAADVFFGNVLTGNSAQHGGGAFFEGTADGLVLVSNSLIENIASKDGGGMHCAGSGHCRCNEIARNEAGRDGGGVYIAASWKGPYFLQSFTHNRLIENTAVRNGGGVFFAPGADVGASSNLVAGNTAGEYGGGVFCWDAEVAAVCFTVTGNTAGLGGGGAACRLNARLTAGSGIFWANAAPFGPEISLMSSSGADPTSLLIDYCDVAGGQGSVFVDSNCTSTWGAGMIEADPLFVDAANKDFHLQQHPCQPGVANPCVEAGDPDPGSRVIGSTRTDGEQDWGVVDMGFHHHSFPVKDAYYVPDDYPTIQSAIDSALRPETIVVRPGTYRENINFRGAAITIRSERGAGVTVIDGGWADRVVTFCNDEGRDSVLDGFTITNGIAQEGGGIGCDHASPTIINNVVVANGAAAGGGGIHLNESYALVGNNVIAGNEVGSGGQGGGIDCTGHPTLVNNTIADNTCHGAGGGIAVRGGADATVVNTILWNNHAYKGQEIYIGTPASPSWLAISNSDVRGGQSLVHVEPGSTVDWGPGIINADPLFAGAGAGDWHLTAPSPCRNAGTTSAQDLTLCDWEGDARDWSDEAVDVGADEYSTHLYHLGAVTPGEAIQVRVVGAPGDSVLLALGSGIRDEPYVTQMGKVWLDPPYTSYAIGKVPASGVLIKPLTVPGSWTAGAYPFQAHLGGRITNLMVLTVE